MRDTAPRLFAILPHAAHDIKTLVPKLAMLPSTRERLAPRPSMLDNGTSIVVVSGSKIYVWDGADSSNEAKGTARTFASQVNELFFSLQGTVVEVTGVDGSANEEFAAVLSLDGVEGGEPSYLLPSDPIPVPVAVATAPTTTTETTTTKTDFEGPYLFKCSEGRTWDRHKVYYDMDLVPDYMFILITATLVFAWVGGEFAAANGLSGEDGASLADAKVNEFLKNVNFKDDGYDGCVAKLSAALDGGTVQVNAAGEESDEYWDAFESGY